MAILRRLVSGIAWIALIAAGLYLVSPGLFPQVQVPLPPDLGEEPRRIFGAAFLVIGGAIGLGAMLRPPRRNAAVAFAGPNLGGSAPRPSAPRPPAAVAPVAQPEPALRTAPKPEPVVTEPSLPPGPDRSTVVHELQAGDAARDAGKGAKADKHYAAAVSAARALWAVSPADARARSDVAEALSRLAGREQAAGRIETALGLSEEAVELRRSVADAEPDAADPAEALASALAQLAERREARSQPARARDLYGEAAAIAERLSWKEPESQVDRDRLAAFKAQRDRLNAELSANDS